MRLVTTLFALLFALLCTQASALAQAANKPPAGGAGASDPNAPTFEVGVLVGGKPWDITESMMVKDIKGAAHLQSVTIKTPHKAAIAAIYINNTSKLPFDVEYTCVYRSARLLVDKSETQKNGKPCPSVGPTESLYVKRLTVKLVVAPNTTGVQDAQKASTAPAAPAAPAAPPASAAAAAAAAAASKEADAKANDADKAYADAQEKAEESAAAASLAAELAKRDPSKYDDAISKAKASVHDNYEAEKARKAALTLDAERNDSKAKADLAAKTAALTAAQNAEKAPSISDKAPANASDYDIKVGCSTSSPMHHKFMHRSGGKHRGTSPPNGPCDSSEQDRWIDGFTLTFYEKIFALSSSTFSDGASMPQKVGGNKADNPNCVGSNKSPQLSWVNVPEGTKSFAVVVQSVGAINGKVDVNLVAYDIKPDVTSFAEGELSEDGPKFVGGQNSSDQANGGHYVPHEGRIA
jgi:Phosphatidylethanolamine-binding protein